MQGAFLNKSNPRSILFYLQVENTKEVENEIIHNGYVETRTAAQIDADRARCEKMFIHHLFHKDITHA